MDEIGNIRTVHSRRSYIHSDAYFKGQNDGSQVSIHKGVEHARSIRKELPQNNYSIIDRGLKNEWTTESSSN